MRVTRSLRPEKPPHCWAGKENPSRAGETLLENRLFPPRPPPRRGFFPRPSRRRRPFPPPKARPARKKRLFPAPASAFPRAARPRPLPRHGRLFGLFSPPAPARGGRRRPPQARVLSFFAPPRRPAPLFSRTARRPVRPVRHGTAAPAPRRTPTRPPAHFCAFLCESLCPPGGLNPWGVFLETAPPSRVNFRQIQGWGYRPAPTSKKPPWRTA